MFQKFGQFYSELLDQKMGDSTIVVGIIGVFIFLTGFLSHNPQSYGANVLEYKQSSSAQYIMIDGKKYEIILKEVK